MDDMFHVEKTTITDGTIQFLQGGSFYNLYKREFSSPSPNTDYPHTHPYHEIFILLDGQMDYLVEGAVFPLNSGDIALIGAGAPHTKFLNPDVKISILVIEVSKNFFKENDCVPYEKIFTSHRSCDHKINADAAMESGLKSAYKRLLRYCENDPDYCRAVIKSTLIEILYLLNNSEFSTNYVANSHVRQIVDYINDNYTKKITLEDIADELFLTKYYLCKVFKKYTGDTVKGYITKKRIAKVEQLTANGYSISKACLRAGFSDYTSFYKAFSKLNGKPPRDVLW